MEPTEGLPARPVLLFFETSIRNFLDCEAGAGVRHHVALSVVGKERMLESCYFRARLAQENLIKALSGSRDYKIRKLISGSAPQDKAIEQIDTTDQARRAAFGRQYLGLKWPEPHLYYAMFNTEMGSLVLPRCSLSVSNRLSKSQWPERLSNCGCMDHHRKSQFH